MLRVIFSKPNRGPKAPAIFLDRDGVINLRRPDDYVLDWSQFTFLDGIRAALRQLATLQLPMIVISNQAAVGKGLLSPADLEEITNRMHQVLLDDGVTLNAAYYCIHRADENCTCRKPKPGLLYAAASDFDVDLSRSVFIGDSGTDIAAAHAAGCASAWFASETGERLVPEPQMSVRNVGDLFSQVAGFLQPRERSWAGTIE